MRLSFMYRPNRKEKQPLPGGVLWSGLLLFTLAGVLAGAVLFGMALQTGNSTVVFFRALMQHRLGGSFMQAFVLSFLSAFLLQFCALLLSFCAFGCVLLPLLPLAKGISIGALSMYLFTEYSWRGILINAVLYWLPNVLQCLLLLGFVCVAMRCAAALYTLCLRHKTDMSLPNLQRCMLCFAITSSGLLLTGMLESILCALFYGVLFR